jgi:hypothetical protein
MYNHRAIYRDGDIRIRRIIISRPINTKIKSVDACHIDGEIIRTTRNISGIVIINPIPGRILPNQMRPHGIDMVIIEMI